MLGVSRRCSHTGIEIAAWLALTCIAAFGQSTANQGSSAQPSTGESSLAQPSSGTPSSGQSLGDIARENKRKKETEASPATPPKVITNADLPKNPAGYIAPNEDEDRDSAASKPNAKAEKATAAHRAADQRAAAWWRMRIAAQKTVVANLEGQAEQLRTAIRYTNQNNYQPTDAQGNYSGLAYNRTEAWQNARLLQLERQIQQHTRQLEDLQDRARHAGMESAVYDP